MELDQKTKERLISFIEKTREDPHYELEARMYGRNFRKVEIDYEAFMRVFKKLTYKKENNGMALSYKTSQILDIIVQSGYNHTNDFDVTRVSIEDGDEIKKYWLYGNFDKIDLKKVKVIEKEKLDKIDEQNYNLRFSLNYEKPEEKVNKKDKNLVMNKDISKDVQKVFRLKNRYSILSDDGLFSIDLTTTKMGKGLNFKESNTMKELPRYEIEIEFMGQNVKMSDEEIVSKWMGYCGLILSLIQNSENIIKQEVMNRVLEGYARLGDCKLGINDYDFIAASPVTFHRHNLLPSDTKINIFAKYAVSLKADGERHFLYVMKSDDATEHGKIFLFDTNFQVIDTGYVNTLYADTLVEGEVIQSDRRRYFFAYDILFDRGRDVRKRYLFKESFEDKPKFSPRFFVLKDFMESSLTKLGEGFTEDNSIPLQLKPIKFLLYKKGDEQSIFKGIKDMWESRSLAIFHCDGLIFTPIKEFYPNRGGTWNHLLKWKPPHLNTIDFLIRTLKYDNGKDIKSPHLTLINRPDGKLDSEIRQYKSVRLFVGTFKRMANGKKVPVAVEFNPDQLNSESAGAYNIANVMLNDEDKMIAIDPFTQFEETIETEQVVEFGYDETLEEGYRWKPYRHRKDKTLLYKAGKKIANAEMTAIDVFNSIRFPVTEEMILTGKVPITDTDAGVVEAVKPYFAGIENNNQPRDRLPYQNFHNLYIKFILYYGTSPAVIENINGIKGRILDLCAGKGVDMNKIAKAKYEDLVGIERDAYSVKKSQEFFKQLLTRPKKAFFMRGDTSKLIFPEQACGITDNDKVLMKRFIPTKYTFDTVSLMFCIHYFFENEITLRTIIQNITDNLKIGGYVIGTTFDGERIYNSLKGKNFVEGKKFDGSTMWKIEKKYKTKLSFDGKPVLGKQIDVIVGSIGQVHPEYLVSFAYFEKMMMEYGFEKVYVKPFSEFFEELKSGNHVEGFSEEEMELNRETISKMSEDEKRFSFFSNAFVFRKVKNAPDTLFRKLLSLLDKKKVKEDVVDGQTSEVTYSIVDKDTSETIIATEEEEEKKMEEEEEIKEGGSQEEEIPGLDEVAEDMTESIANKVASRVLIKVADKINSSIKPVLPSQQIISPEKMGTFVPPPMNERRLKEDNENSKEGGITRNIKIEYINHDGESEKEEEVSESGDEYDSDDMKDV